jgi:hypothetical protein
LLFAFYFSAAFIIADACFFCGRKKAYQADHHKDEDGFVFHGYTLMLLDFRSSISNGIFHKSAIAKSAISN